MFKKIRSDELIKGSIVLFITFNIFNLLNFIFQFSMARLLGPVEFGVFASIMTLLYFLALPSESIQTVVSRYTSKFYVNKDYGKIKSLLVRSLRKGLFFSALLFVILVPVFFLFSYFLNISFWLVLVSGLILFSFFLIPTTRGVMQGTKKFNALGINMILDSSIKVVVAIFLVYIGWGVYGAVLSIIIGGIAALLLSFIPIIDITSKKGEETDFSGIYKYGSPVIFILLPVLLMQSIDVFIARRIFSPDVAGHYAVANLIGKMIFFGTLAVAKSMFPLSSEKFEGSELDKGKTKGIFYKSLIMVLGLCLVSLLFLSLFPELIISLLFGQEYLEISNIILNIGIAFSFISLANLLLLYGISISKKVNITYVITFVFFVVIQTFILWNLSSNLESFSLGMIFSTFLLFIGSIIFVLKK